MMQNAPQLAINTCKASLPLMHMSSAVVERSHLVGQELKPPRSRGRAVDAENLAIRSYQKFCVNDGEKIKNAVENAALKARGLSRCEFHALTSTFRLGKSQRADAMGQSASRKVARRVASESSARRTRKKDGWTAFRTESWSVQGARVGSDEFKAESH